MSESAPLHQVFAQCLISRYNSIYRDWATNATSCGEEYDVLDRTELAAALADEARDAILRLQDAVVNGEWDLAEARFVQYTCLPPFDQKHSAFTVS